MSPTNRQETRPDCFIFLNQKDLFILHSLFWFRTINNSIMEVCCGAQDPQQCESMDKSLPLELSYDEVHDVSKNIHGEHPHGKPFDAAINPNEAHKAEDDDDASVGSLKMSATPSSLSLMDTDNPPTTLVRKITITRLARNSTTTPRRRLPAL